ncbi:hypothetical protein CCP2SC5_1590006 [Azospirillaceae bacterium]
MRKRRPMERRITINSIEYVSINELAAIRGTTRQAATKYAEARPEYCIKRGPHRFMEATKCFE